MPSSGICDHQPLAALVVSCLLRSPLFGDPAVVVKSRPDLGGPGSACPPGDGWCAGWDDPLASPTGIPAPTSASRIISDLSLISVERLPEQSWLLNSCVQNDQRDQLARFGWRLQRILLPSLWSSPVGESTKALVRALTPQTSFTPDQVATREAIGARLQAGFQAPMAIQLLLANFLYSPPGLLKIANASLSSRNG